VLVCNSHLHVQLTMETRKNRTAVGEKSAMSSRDAIARNTVAAEVTSESRIYVRVKMSKNDFLRQFPMFLSMFRWILDFVF